jgi:hypothetical protein
VVGASVKAPELLASTQASWYISSPNVQARTSQVRGLSRCYQGVDTRLERSEVWVTTVARQTTRYQGRPLRALALILFMICALSIAPRDTAAAASGGPSLTFVTRAGHSLAVTGGNWGHHVIVTAQIGASRAGDALVTSAGGRFAVALDFSIACGGITVEARDLRGDDETLKRPGPLCPNREGEPPPVLTVLQGVQSTAHVRTIGFSSAPRTLVLRIGETLQLIERAGSSPHFTPSADAQHFVLLQQGGSGSVLCAASCLATGNLFWKWVAAKRGHGTVSLSPTCRQTQPPCEMPERVIDVTITT